MRTDRPMSEYENALFAAVRILGEMAVGMGLNESLLLAKLKEAQNDFTAMGSENGAATLALLARALCEPPISYIPRNPN